MTQQRAPAAEALLRSRKSAAKELGLPVTDARVIRLSVWLMQFDLLQAKLASGHAIDSAELRLVDTELAAIRDAAPETIKVDLQIAEGVHGHAQCPHCGKGFDIAPGNYTPASPQREPAPTIDATVVAEPVEKPAPKALPAPAKPDYVPATNWRALGAPIKGTGASAYGASLNGNPFSAGPKPNWDGSG